MFSLLPFKNNNSIIPKETCTETKVVNVFYDFIRTTYTRGGQLSRFGGPAEICYFYSYSYWSRHQLVDSHKWYFRGIEYRIGGPHMKTGHKNIIFENYTHFYIYRYIKTGNIQRKCWFLQDDGLNEIYCYPDGTKMVEKWFSNKTLSKEILFGPGGDVEAIRHYLEDGQRYDDGKYSIINYQKYTGFGGGDTRFDVEEWTRICFSNDEKVWYNHIL